MIGILIAFLLSATIDLCEPTLSDVMLAVDEPLVIRLCIDGAPHRLFCYLAEQEPDGACA